MLFSLCPSRLSNAFAGVFAWAGLTLSPAIGAVLMSASTIMVALNAQLLRRVKLTPARP